MKSKKRLSFLSLFLIGVSSLALTISTENIEGQVKVSQTKKDFRADLLKRLQGIWIHEKDKKASILIKEKSWAFYYSGENHTADDNYLITITNQLPQFIDKSEKAEFLILTQKTDTLQYEILGLTEKTLSLMHFSSGKRHLYKKI